MKRKATCDLMLDTYRVIFTRKMLNIDEISHFEVCGRAIFVRLVCPFDAKRSLKERNRVFAFSLRADFQRYECNLARQRFHVGRILI